MEVPGFSIRTISGTSQERKCGEQVPFRRVFVLTSQPDNLVIWLFPLEFQQENQD